MPGTPVSRAPHSAAGLRRLWGFTASPYRTQRRRTRQVRVGAVGIGGDNPIRVQSMTISDTLDTATLLDEIEALWRAGSELVRVTAPNRRAAEHLGVIRAGMRQRGIDVPLVADIHFTPQAAWIAAEHVEKVRINPGNFADRKHFKKWEYTDAEYDEELERLERAFAPLVLRCRETGTAMRIGTNHGSLSDRIMNRYGDTPEGMVESALEFVSICERHHYHDIVLSMKASDVKVMVQAYRLLAVRLQELGMDYPFHLGVTEAGSGLAARIKSAIGIGTLLQDGLGDTVRVSLTEDSVHELPVCREICAPFRTAFENTSATSAAGTSGASAASRAASHAGDAPDATLPPPAWNPIRFARRDVAAVGSGEQRLAAEQPPRLELVMPVTDETAWTRILHHDAAPDLVLLDVEDIDAATDLVTRRLTQARQRSASFGVGLQLPAPQATSEACRALAPSLARLSLRLHGDDAPSLATTLRDVGAVALQLCLAADVVDEDTRIDAMLRVLDGTRPVAVALETRRAGTTLAQTWRRILALRPHTDFAVLLREPDGGPLADGPLAHAGNLHTAMALGALLVDGIGDGLQLHAGDDPAARLELGRQILQATRLRLSVADFIACPSCGRTQFDLQSTAARVEARFRHLKGLKIAIMGCIVNGPGEMADADFGYVGSGPGRIDLYVGHERVARAIREDEAVDRLEQLIRARGRWTPRAGNNSDPQRVPI